MSTGHKFTIMPIPDRECVQQRSALLPNKANKYDNKKISLNERFMIIDRGFFLEATEFPESDALPTQLTIEKKQLISKNEFLENFHKKNDNGKAKVTAAPVKDIYEEMENDQENASPTKKPENVVVAAPKKTKGFEEEFIENVKSSILQPIS